MVAIDTACDPSNLCKGELNGATLFNEKDLGRYPDFKAIGLEHVTRTIKKEDLKTALYG